MTPSTASQVLLNPPVVEVVIALERATPVQETGTVSLIGAGRVTVGWPEALLHWRRMPMLDVSYPSPVTAIGVPPLRQVPGSAVRVGGPPDDVVNVARD